VLLVRESDTAVVLALGKNGITVDRVDDFLVCSTVLACFVAAVGLLASSEGWYWVSGFSLRLELFLSSVPFELLFEAHMFK
jgi:hypothetical protein